MNTKNIVNGIGQASKKIAKGMAKTSKKAIKGVAKTTGKYSLKGIGKLVEFTGRTGIRTVDALVKNRSLQKIVTTAGLLAASVAIPGVGPALIGCTAIKYMTENAILGKNKGLLAEVNDMINLGTTVTRGVSNIVLRPALHELDKGAMKLGKNYQDKIDDLFK